MYRRGSHLQTTLVALLAALGLALVAAPAANATCTSAVEGQVLAWMDPIGSARVTVYNATTGAAIKGVTTDGEGYYRIGGLPAVKVKVRASKAGYLDSWASGASSRATATVYQLQPGQTLRQTWDEKMVLYLDLTPEAAISGSIMGFSYHPVSGWDDPVAGVTVTAFDAVTGAAVGSTTTDYTGDFRIGKLRQGKVKVRASKPGWITSWAHDKWTKASAETFFVEPYSTTDISTLAIYAPAGISGSVMVDDEPIAHDVTVALVDATTGATIRSIVDDDGYFQFTGLPPLHVQVKATGPFYTTGWANWATSRGSATTFDLVPGVVLGSSGSEGAYINVVSTGTISGQVLGNFDPLGGATVTVFDAQTGAAVKSTRADGDGYYRIDKIPVGFAGRDIKVRATKPGWLPSWANGKTSRATATVLHLYSGQHLKQSWDPMVLYLDLRPITTS